MFGDVINPKLSELIKSVSEFTGLTGDIFKFITSLRGVSTYLNNVNPAQELLNLIKSFNGDTYITPIKSHIEQLLDELENKMKYEEIIGHLHSLARPYNQDLKREYESFKKKIEEHKTSLEQSIKEYIDNINTCLTKQCCCVEELRKLICENLKILESNHSKLGQFIYTKEEQILKTCTILENEQKESYKKIFKTHETYKKCLESCYSKIKCELTKFICDLNIYNCYICRSIKIIEQYNKNGINDSNIVEKITNVLNSLNRLYVNKFGNYLGCVQKLEKIGGYITTMKEELKLVQDKVRPEAKNYIDGLENITIKQSEVEEDIRKIKGVNESVIDRLKIAKHTIEFHKSLESAINNLKGVTVDVYYYYDHRDIDYLKHEFSKVKAKVESFQKKIESKHCEAKTEINKMKQQIQEAGKEGLKCDGKTIEMSDDPLSKVLACIDKPLEDARNILSFINNSLNVINVIKYLLPRIQNNKSQSPDISSIKSKVTGISKLKGATTKLTQAVKDLRNFVDIQTKTKDLIEKFKDYPKFTSLSRYSSTLGEIINDSNIVIEHINNSIDYLTTIGYVNNLINYIRRYKSRFETIKGIIENFKLYVKEIIPRVEEIHCNLWRLRCFSCQTLVQYNLWKLKDYMTLLKFYVRNIRDSFDVISSVIDKIKLDSSEMDTYMCDLKVLENYIQCYINWIEKCKQITFIVNYLKLIKDKINEIIMIKYIMIKTSSIKRIETIESRLSCVESSVSDLECAIEGVARNLVRCSLQSTSTHLIKHQDIGVLEINKLLIGVMSRKVIDESLFVLSRLYMYSKIKSEISKVLSMLEHCICIDVFEKYYINSVCSYHRVLPDFEDTESINWDIVRNDVHSKENVSCLCMIIRYRLIPEVYLIIRYNYYMDFEILSTISRRFKKYLLPKYDKSLIFKLVYLVIQLIHKITLWTIYKYSDDVRKGYCFCNRYDKNLIYVKLIIRICELIENIWTMDTQSIRMSIEKLSCLLSEFEMIDSQNDKSSKNNHLDIFDRIIIGSYHITNITIGLIFESLKFLAYYLRSIIALLPTQTLSLILFWQYLFNIVFSIGNFPKNIINLYNILEFSFDTVLSNFILIPELLFKFINRKDDCKNKKCVRRMMITLSTKIVNYKIRWVKKNIINNNRLYNIKETNNSLIIIKSIVNSYFNYNKLGITLIKNLNSYPGSIGSYKGVKDASTTNWGYDAIYEHSISILSNQNISDQICILDI